MEIRFFESDSRCHLDFPLGGMKFRRLEDLMPRGAGLAIQELGKGFMVVKVALPPLEH